MSYTIINQRLFGIQLFEHPTDIMRLSSYFYMAPEISESPMEEVIQKPIEEIKKKPIEEIKKKPIEEIKKKPIEEIKKKPIEEIKKKPIEEIKKKPIEDVKKKLTLPQDTLFWNIYIWVYGLTEYKLIGSKFANVEWTEKNNIRMAFMTNPKALQTTNQKVTLGNIQEMMSEYMTGGKTTLLGLIGMSVYYKVPIYLFDSVKKRHLKFVPENVERPPCILFSSFHKYELYNGNDDIETLCKNSFCLESYHRPLRAISSYKRAELDAIGELYGMDVSDKSKDQLYKALSEHLVWIL